MVNPAMAPSTTVCPSDMTPSASSAPAPPAAPGQGARGRRRIPERDASIPFDPLDSSPRDPVPGAAASPPAPAPAPGDGRSGRPAGPAADPPRRARRDREELHRRQSGGGPAGG